VIPTKSSPGDHPKIAWCFPIDLSARKFTHSVMLYSTSCQVSSAKSTDFVFSSALTRPFRAFGRTRAGGLVSSTRAFTGLRHCYASAATAMGFSELGIVWDRMDR
jgi:hypothetical protein